MKKINDFEKESKIREIYFEDLGIQINIRFNRKNKPLKSQCKKIFDLIKNIDNLL